MTPEERKRLEEAAESMLERMTIAGWIESARNRQNLVIRWTQSGIEASRQVGILFNKLGPDIGAYELAALLNIVESLSPGGSESEGNALD
jgi:hypothetical protein